MTDIRNDGGSNSVNIKKLLIGALIAVATTLLLGMTTWNFSATQGAVQADEHIVEHDKQDSKIDKVQKTVDDIKNLILELHTK